MLCTVEVALSKDLSSTFFTRSHLGHLLKPGDHCLGYFLKNANFNNDQFDELNERIRSSSRLAHLGGGLPDVVLIKKSYPNARKKNKGRKWRLKNLAKEKEDEAMSEQVTKQAKTLANRTEMDYEIFLRDLEEDAELRSMVNLYKDQRKQKKPMEVMEEEAEPEEDFPEIEMGELLEDMDALHLAEVPKVSSEDMDVDQ